MKKFVLAAAVAALAATPALAAKAKKTPPAPPPTPAYSWSGCYVGVNGGYGWNNGSTHYNDPNTTSDPINFIGGAPFVSVPTPSATRGTGGLGGGGVGCNLQNQQWVFGLEADFDGGRISGNQTNSITAGAAQIIQIGTGALVAPVATASEHSQLNWLSTIRGRVGLAIQDRLLLFATGGLAVGGVNTQGSVSVIEPSTGHSIVWSGAHSTDKLGTAIGGGAEWAFADRWTAKAEYLWYDLGNASHPLNCSASVGLGAACSSASFFSTLGSAVASFHGSIVRFGINYRFN